MKNLKIGVFGAGRGLDIAQNFKRLNCDIVAICDFNKDRLNLDNIEKEYNAKTFSDFDEFLNCDLDAVIVANFFPEHAPFVIKCFKKNISVFCECLSNSTMAEGVMLLKEFKKTKSIFMLAENYPQMLFNREIKRVCDTGTLGKFIYAEGEYNHPVDPKDMSFAKIYNYTPKHWRNFLPQTYYITHSLGPIMWATGATPKKVTAFSVFAPVGRENPTFSFVGDIASFIMTQNDDGSVFKFTGSASCGAHGNSYRVVGEKGQIENIRGMDDKVMLRYNGWDIPEGKEEINCYTPSWNDKDEEKIKESGHGGSDYLTARYFISCVKQGVQPEHPFDIYSAVNMSSVAILAQRSVLSGGMSFDIPDLTKPKWIKMYKDDNLSPFWNGDNPPTIPCCSNPKYKPTKKQINLKKKLLKD